MILTPITPNLTDYPAEIRSLLSGAKLYDSSCSPEAKVIFVNKDSGYFLKSANKGVLEHEAEMTKYFHGKGLRSFRYARTPRSRPDDIRRWMP